MNCKKFRYTIPDLVKTRLSGTEKKLMEEHLATCVSCRQEVEEFRALFSTMEGETVWKPSEQYLAAILPRVHQRLDHKQSISLPVWITRLAVPLASAAVIVIFLAKILPFNSVDSSSNSIAALARVPADDLNEYMEQQSVIGVTDFSASDNKVKESSEDNIILKNILVEEHTGYSYLTTNQESIDDIVSDRDVDELMPVLEKQYSTSLNE